MPVSFNAVDLCEVTINEKPWIRAREVCRTLEYGKATRTAHVKKLMSTLKISLIRGS